MGYVKTVTGDASVIIAVLLGSQLKTAKGAANGLDFTRFFGHIPKLGHKIHSVSKSEGGIDTLPKMQMSNKQADV